MFDSVYFSRGTLPTKKVGREGHLAGGPSSQKGTGTSPAARRIRCSWLLTPPHPSRRWTHRSKALTARAAVRGGPLLAKPVEFGGRDLSECPAQKQNPEAHPLNPGRLFELPKKLGSNHKKRERERCALNVKMLNGESLLMQLGVP